MASPLLPHPPAAVGSIPGSATTTTAANGGPPRSTASEEARTFYERARADLSRGSVHRPRRRINHLRPVRPPMARLAVLRPGDPAAHRSRTCPATCSRSSSTCRSDGCARRSCRRWCRACRPAAGAPLAASTVQRGRPAPATDPQRRRAGPDAGHQPGRRREAARGVTRPRSSSPPRRGRRHPRRHRPR